MTLLSRGLVTAPATGELTCRLYAIFVNHTSTRVYSRITVLVGTSLQLLYAPIDSSAQTWQVSKSLVNTAYAAARVRFTPAAGASSVRASGRPGVRRRQRHGLLLRRQGRLPGCRGQT